MDNETVYLTVVPADGKCEGCGDPVGDAIFETDDMVRLCKKCWQSMRDDAPNAIAAAKE